jgi:hypothetical protein
VPKPDNEAYRHNNQQGESQTKQTLLTAPHNPLTCSIRLMCVCDEHIQYESQSTVSVTKKPDSKELCHGDVDL